MIRGVRRGRLVLALLAAPALAGVAGCGGQSEGGGERALRVDAADFRFVPARVDVRAGQKVSWTNTGRTEHTVKGPGFFTTRALGPGQSYTHRFAGRGSYRYVCTLHPTLMTGTVVVG